MKHETAKVKTQLSQIETAAELISLINWQGISTKMEDICRMQDIIGHSTVEELDRLANKKETQSNFYHLLSVIWRWDNVIEYWNTHTNPEHKELKETKEELNRYKKWYQQKTDRVEELNGQIREAADQWSKEFKKSTDLEDQLKAKDREIMELKAKLYDMMVKGNGAA